MFLLILEKAMSTVTICSHSQSLRLCKFFIGCRRLAIFCNKFAILAKNCYASFPWQNSDAIQCFDKEYANWKCVHRYFSFSDCGIEWIINKNLMNEGMQFLKVWNFFSINDFPNKSGSHVIIEKIYSTLILGETNGRTWYLDFSKHEYGNRTV